MYFSDADIDFTVIDWRQFEELCYELLTKTGFHSLTWRQGGGDQGRDIEAKFSRSNLLVNSQDEKWFIECKHYSKGLNVGDISGKVSWAEAERADVFLLITTGYLTNDTRHWLNLKQSGVHFKIETIEGKGLKQKILSYPEIVEKYFLSTQHARLVSIKKQWLHFNVLPNARSFYDLYKEIDFHKLELENLAFLTFVVHELDDQMETFCLDEGIEEPEIKEILPMFIGHRNCDYSAFKEVDNERGKILSLSRFEHSYHSVKKASDNGDAMLLLHDKTDSGQLLDVMIKRDGKQLDVKVSLR